MDDVSRPSSPSDDEDNEYSIPTDTTPIVYITRFVKGSIIYIDVKTLIKCDTSCPAFSLAPGKPYIIKDYSQDKKMVNFKDFGPGPIEGKLLTDVLMLQKHYFTEVAKRGQTFKKCHILIKEPLKRRRGEHYTVEYGDDNDPRINPPIWNDDLDTMKPQGGAFRSVLDGLPSNQDSDDEDLDNDDSDGTQNGRMEKDDSDDEYVDEDESDSEDTDEPTQQQGSSRKQLGGPKDGRKKSSRQSKQSKKGKDISKVLVYQQTTPLGQPGFVYREEGANIVSVLTATSSQLGKELQKVLEEPGSENHTTSGSKLWFIPKHDDQRDYDPKNPPLFQSESPSRQFVQNIHHVGKLHQGFESMSNSTVSSEKTLSNQQHHNYQQVATQDDSKMDEDLRPNPQELDSIPIDDKLLSQNRPISGESRQKQSQNKDSALYKDNTIKPWPKLIHLAKKRGFITKHFQFFAELEANDPTIYCPNVLHQWDTKHLYENQNFQPFNLFVSKAQQQSSVNLSQQGPLNPNNGNAPPLPPPLTAASPDETINQHHHLFPYIQYSIPILYTNNLLYALESGFTAFPNIFTILSAQIQSQKVLNDLEWKRQHYMTTFLALIPSSIVYAFYLGLELDTSHKNHQVTITQDDMYVYMGVLLFLARYRFTHYADAWNLFPWLGFFMNKSVFEAIDTGLVFGLNVKSHVQGEDFRHFNVNLLNYEWNRHYRVGVAFNNWITIDETRVKWLGKGKWDLKGSHSIINTPGKPEPVAIESKTVATPNCLIIGIQQVENQSTIGQTTSCQRFDVANTTDYDESLVQETPHFVDRHSHRDGDENYLLRVQIERFENRPTQKVSITNQTSINNSSDDDDDDEQLSTTTTTTGKGPQKSLSHQQSNLSNNVNVTAQSTPRDIQTTTNLVLRLVESVNPPKDPIDLDELQLSDDFKNIIWAHLRQVDLNLFKGLSSDSYFTRPASGRGLFHDKHYYQVGTVKKNPKDYPSKLFDVMGPLLNHGDWAEFVMIDDKYSDHQFAYIYLNSKKPRQFLSTLPKSGIYGLQHGCFVDKRAKKLLGQQNETEDGDKTTTTTTTTTTTISYKAQSSTTTTTQDDTDSKRDEDVNTGEHNMSDNDDVGQNDSKSDPMRKTWVDLVPLPLILFNNNANAVDNANQTISYLGFQKGKQTKHAAEKVFRSFVDVALANTINLCRANVFNTSDHEHPFDGFVHAMMFGLLHFKFGAGFKDDVLLCHHPNLVKSSSLLNTGHPHNKLSSGTTISDNCLTCGENTPLACKTCSVLTHRRWWCCKQCQVSDFNTLTTITAKKAWLNLRKRDAMKGALNKNHRHSKTARELESYYGYMLSNIKRY